MLVIQLHIGYKKNPDEPGKLIIDKYASKIVKRIFLLTKDGLTAKQVAEELNKDEIPTPAQYLKIKGLSTNVNQIWTRVSVVKILGNPVYTGDCIRGKTQNISYKSKKRVFVKRKDFIVTENTHQAIISKELFNAVHKNNNYGITKEENSVVNTKFGNLMYCAYCHKKMGKRNQRDKINLHCANNRISNELCKFEKNYFYEKIEPLIIEEISNTFKKYFNDNTLRNRILKRYNTVKIKELTKDLKDKDMDLRRVTFKVSKLYNDRLSGEIKEEEYKKQYEVLVAERKEIEISIEKTKQDLEEFKKRGEELNLKTDIVKELMKKISKNEITDEDAKKIIKKIEIGNEFIIIHFNFSDTDDKKISCTY